LNKRNQRRSGYGLLYVLLLTTLVSGFASEAFRASRHQFFLAASHAQKLQASSLARAGVNLARAGLILDDNEFDDLEEDWAILSMMSQMSPLPVGNGFVSVLIEDEEGRQNLNAMNESELLEYFKALNLKRVKQGDILDLDIVEQNIERELVDSYLDWIDHDDVERQFGAESIYYKRQRKSIPHNQPLATLAELLLIKGFTGDMLFGRKGNPRLYDMLTIYGPGKININTTSRAVLESIIKMEQPYSSDWIVDALMQYRPYKTDAAFQSMAARYGLSQGIIERFKVKSEYFRVLAKGIIGSVEEIVEVIVKRSGQKCDILVWREGLKGFE